MPDPTLLDRPRAHLLRLCAEGGKSAHIRLRLSRGFAQRDQSSVGIRNACRYRRLRRAPCPHSGPCGDQTLAGGVAERRRKLALVGSACASDLEMALADGDVDLNSQRPEFEALSRAPARLSVVDACIDMYGWSGAANSDALERVAFHARGYLACDRIAMPSPQSREACGSHSAAGPGSAMTRHWRPCGFTTFRASPFSGGPCPSAQRAGEPPAGLT